MVWNFLGILLKIEGEKMNQILVWTNFSVVISTGVLSFKFQATPGAQLGFRTSKRGSSNQIWGEIDLSE